MATTQRTAMRALRRGPNTLQQSARRQASHSAEGHAAHTSTPKSESFGTSFYLVVGLIPTIYVVYTVSRPGANGQPSSFTKIINSYADLRESNQQRNALHTRMVEQAGHDRNLFYNSPGELHHELRFPETFSTGSPKCVPAGHGGANLDQLVEHYRMKQFKEEELKIQKLKEDAARLTSK